MSSLAAVVLLIALFALSADSQSCTHASVRLVGGSGPYEGNVQVCNQGVWGWVCDNSWSSNDAQVVCRQLGYSTSYAIARPYSYYGWGNGTIWLDHMYCSGSEANLLACSHAYSVGVTYCGYGEMAGVYCHTLNSGQTCPEGQVRLSNLYQSSYGRSEGRVEYCHNNQWGTVCDDSWNSPDARVTCFQLGYSRTGAQSFSWGYFGWGTGNIWLDNVGCSGSENSLASCSKNCLGCHNCYHGEDAGVRCYSRDTSSCTNNQIKLWSAYGHTNEGILLICKNNAWTAACRYYYSCYIAKTACQQLGYSGALGLRSNAGFYYGYYYNNDQYRYYCYSYHTSLSQCYPYYYSSCGSYNDALGVVCYSGGSQGVCTNGDVRLTGGNTTAEGRVEYCSSGSWAPMCSLSTATASLVCKSLGYTAYTWASIFNDERFGRNGTESNFNYLSCSSSHANLSQCTVYYKGSGCYVSTSSCYREYGIRCYTPGECTDGQSRLVNGTIEQEGRVEVCVNGVWGGVCRWGFSYSDAFVFCNSLGYDGPYPTIWYNGYQQFGYNTGPVVWSYVGCNGWEKDLFACSKYTYTQYTCGAQYLAAVTCKDACTNGDVRILGGGFDNEGTVEVCYYNVWGLVSDSGWTSGDATVVCNQLGYTGGIAMPVTGSKYGKPNKTIHFKDVSCSGQENNLAECSKTVLSLTNGKLALASTSVAGVDCIYDVPTDPPCIAKPVLNPGSDCEAHSVRLVTETGAISTDAGRAEYCYNGIWTPFCKMDTNVATVICRQMGHSAYTWATVQPGSFGVTTNYSLFDNITCTGSETNINQCTVNEAPDDCTPYCAITNIAVRCFDPNTVNCQEGSIRLADGIIENEGRVEFCVNGVWGSVCDNGWDATDAHIVCTQLGHPELQPRLFTNSYFGGGNFPIIYSNLGCIGWEKNVTTDCSKDMYGDFTCTRDNIAGVLCGYDCNDGDVRLVGGSGPNEGTIEVCFENLWGLVAETGWTQTDANVVCRQLGYATEGVVAMTGSAYGKPAKTIYMSGVQCIGSEATIHDCTFSTYSLQEGKDALQTTDVAGVQCPIPASKCQLGAVSSCTDKQLRLVGSNSQNGEGNLQYCYQGTWSSFCSLGANEATVACRELGFIGSDLVSIFDDGRYGSMPNNTQFTNFTCSPTGPELRLSDCTLNDDCQMCQNPIAIQCSAQRPTNTCRDGDVRLVNGSIAQEGRVEVCLNNVWGSLCGDGFDKSDALVVCRQLGQGDFEPTVYTNSYFGSGTGPVLYSQLGCRGYETALADCSKASYGSFRCSSGNIAGLVCQDSCTNGDIQLVGGNNSAEGTVEICYSNYWGLISTRNWNNSAAQVVCRQLGYNNMNSNPTAIFGSVYGKPNKTVQLSSVECTGSESNLDDCNKNHIPPDEGRYLYQHIDAAGVNCFGQRNATAGTSASTSQGAIAGTSIVAVVLVAVLILIVILVIVIVFQKKRRNHLTYKSTSTSRLSTFGHPGVEGLDQMGFPDPDVGQDLYDQVPR